METKVCIEVTAISPRGQCCAWTLPPCTAPCHTAAPLHPSAPPSSAFLSVQWPLSCKAHKPWAVMAWLPATGRDAGRTPGCCVDALFPAVLQLSRHHPSPCNSPHSAGVRLLSLPCFALLQPPRGYRKGLPLPLPRTAGSIWKDEPFGEITFSLSAVHLL